MPRPLMQVPTREMLRMRTELGAGKRRRLRRQADRGGAKVVHWAGVKRVVQLPTMVAVLSLLGAALLAGSCLNPRPEELPSADNEPSSPLEPGPGTATGNPGIGGDVLGPNLDDGDAPSDNESNGQSPDPSPGDEAVPPSSVAPNADAGVAPPFAAGSDGGVDGG